VSFRSVASFRNYTTREAMCRQNCALIDPPTKIEEGTGEMSDSVHSPIIVAAACSWSY